MQVPPIIPKVNAPGPNELRPEPVQRIAPMVMNDAAIRPDPSVILNTPVPVSQGPRDVNRARQALDQTGPLHVSEPESEEPQALRHLTKLAMTIEAAESGPHTVKWPMPRQPQQEPGPRPWGQKSAGAESPALAPTPQQAMAQLRQGLAQSPMLAASLAAEALGLVKSRSAASPKQQTSAASSLTALADADSSTLREGVTLLMHGQLAWQGELTPGVRARVYREDVYSKDPHNPAGALVKGAQLQIELELPHLGPLVVRGLQVEDQVSVSLRPDRTNRGYVAERFEELKTHMAKADMGDVSLWFQGL